MTIWKGQLNARFQLGVSKCAGSGKYRQTRFWRYFFAAALGLLFTSGFGGVSFAQRQAGTGTRLPTGVLTLFGDIKVDETQVDNQKPLTLDVILYSTGGWVIARQKVSNNGRYRFLNVLSGEYYLAVELENIEATRIYVLVTGQSGDDIQRNISLEWRATAQRTGSRPGVISAADAYNRVGHNKSLYQKSAAAIATKNYSEATATLRELVVSDPNDFPAWFELGNVYSIQKDYEAAEKCYVTATTLRPSYFPAQLNLGRIQLVRKNYERAIPSLEASLRIEEKSAFANYLLVGYLNTALKLEPIKMAEAHLLLAALYDGAGMKEKATVEYELFLLTQPDYPDRNKLQRYIAENKKQ
jgi:tetratricopeptide (TPR) repeat protein